MKTLEQLSELRFDASQLARFRRLGEFLGRQPYVIRQQPEVLDTLRQVATLESVEYGNSLENIVASREVIRKLVLQEIRPRTPVERQIAGYHDALETVVDPAEHTNITVSLVSQLHAVLYSYLPHEGGRWKATNKVIMERDAEGNRKGILYRTVPASETAAAMQECIDLYQGAIKRSVEPVIVVACAVLDLFCIHPFSDGNGRMARLMALLMLSLNGYQAGRYISIERIFAQDKEAYFDIMQRSIKGWDEGNHDPMPWINFFLDALIRAYQELEVKVTALQGQSSRAPKSQLIAVAIEERQGPFSVADISLQIPTVSRELVKKVIQGMRSQGLLKPVGKGRGAQWEKCQEADRE